MNEIPKIRVLIEVPVLRKDGTLFVTRCYAESMPVQRGTDIDRSIRRCVRRALESAIDDFQK